MVHFVSMRCTSGFCFVSCHCFVADNVNKEIGNAPLSHKQCPLIKTALTIYGTEYCLFNQANLESFECSSHAGFRTNCKNDKFTFRQVNRNKCLRKHFKKQRGPYFHLDCKGRMTAVSCYRYYTLSSLKNE